MQQGKLKCGHQTLDLTCKYCRALYNKWGKELKKDGFEDAEKLAEKQPFLKAPTSYQGKRSPNSDENYKGNDESQDSDYFDLMAQQNQEDFDQKRSYFDQLCDGVNRNEFDNEVDRYVMTRLSEGARIM